MFLLFLVLVVSVFQTGSSAVADTACTDTAGQKTCSITNAICSSDDKCACKTGYTEEEDKCKIALDKTCNRNEDCVTNADCVATGNGKKCQCKANYKDKSGLCASSSAVWIPSALLILISIFCSSFRL